MDCPNANSKLIISYLVGGRDAEWAGEFMQDVADRLANRVQLTTDGHKPYLGAVEDAFGADISSPCWSRFMAKLLIRKARSVSTAPANAMVP